MATLTGAQGPATGRYHAALLTNNEQWERACVQVGKNCGDLCFPLVFAPELHFSEFKSELADMRNSVIVILSVFVFFNFIRLDFKVEKKHF
jgi:probable aminopeptidase NPEPL1